MRFVVVAALCACVVGCASADTQGRLDGARSRVHGGAAVTDEDAVAYADAVAAGVKEGLADASDVDDVLYVLRLRLAATSTPAPLLEARGRLFLAADRHADGEASFVEAALAQPSSTNALALLQLARDRRDVPRMVALCGSPPLEVDLHVWGAACQEALDHDMQFLLAGADASTACLGRCRASSFRAVAACADAACYLRNNKAHEICTATCSDEVTP